MIDEQHFVQVKSCEEVIVQGISLRKNWQLESRITPKIQNE
jgi:hypothetical protein